MPDAAAPLRAGDECIELPASHDAELYFIGRVRTPFATLAECPKQGRGRDANATLEIDAAWVPGLKDLTRFSHIYVLYWFDRSRRDLVVQTPGGQGEKRGTFSLRSPARPNPIGLHVSELISIDGARVKIRGIDCVDGTPLVDIKPYFGADDAVADARAPERRRGA